MPRPPIALGVLAVLLVGGYFVVKALSPGGSLAKTPVVPGTPSRPLEKEWSAEEVSANPQGYLRWADEHIAEQVKKRNELLGKIVAKRAQHEARGKDLASELDELENFRKRLDTALRRAEDEDRWPVVVGSNRYDKERARQLLAQLPKQIELRRPLAEDYRRLLASIDGRRAQIESEITSLGQLREKIALDVERVTLNQGVEELGKLSRSSAEISHFAKILGEMSEGADAPSATREGDLIPLDKLLK